MKTLDEQPVKDKNENANNNTEPQKSDRSTVRYDVISKVFFYSTPDVSTRPGSIY